MREQVSSGEEFLEDQDLFECTVRAEERAQAALEDPEYAFISIDDEPLFRPFLSVSGERPSELTFGNLFMWRKHYLYSTRLLDGTLLVRGEENGRKFLLEPLGGNVDAGLVHRLLRTGDASSLERVTEPFVRAHIAGDNRFIVEETRDHGDYIYERDDLAHLRGRRYHRKRNYVTRFEAAYRFEYVPLLADHRQECRSIVREWCRYKNCGNDEGLCAELVAAGELIDHFDRLSLVGGLLTVDGKPAAFTLAEKTGDGMAVIHVEKAVPGVVGLYQAINRYFCERSLRGVRFVNREQDLGIEGLRKAKESYFPVRMLRKYRVTLQS